MCKIKIINIERKISNIVVCCRNLLKFFKIKNNYHLAIGTLSLIFAQRYLLDAYDRFLILSIDKTVCKKFI